MRQVILPFSGFYCSLHDSAIDDAIAQLLSDDQGMPLSDQLSSRFVDACDYRYAFWQYAAHYAQQFAEEFTLASLKFNRLDSPREYNFETDRIFCDISSEDIDKMKQSTLAATLAKVAARRHTSRDGFHSFYSPDTADWPSDVHTWDVVQLSTLLEAYVEKIFGDFDRWAELDLMEYALCNGKLDDWVTHAPKAARLAGIASYLRSRRARGGAALCKKTKP